MALAYSYLHPAEVRFLEAATERLIPADAEFGGAREAHVPFFIDGQLASAWGVHGRQYRQGPWREGTPEQGWQSPLTPQEVYRLGIAEADSHCRAAHDRPFHALPPATQDDVLHAMEAGDLAWESVPCALFFSLLLRNTIEGYFADPLYGGNADKVGWRLIGFPGVAASDYVDLLRQHNVPYDVEPVSILDIERRQAQVDAQGYARHPVRVRRSERGAPK
jgi:gluconate 2-dehydrogenase gamma chain